MDRDVLERIANTLESIDTRLERLSAEMNEQLSACLDQLGVIAGAVDQMRDDVSGFDQNGTLVPGHLSRIVDAIGEVATAVNSVETAVTLLDSGA